MTSNPPFSNSFEELGIPEESLEVFRLSDGAPVNGRFLLNARSLVDRRSNSPAIAQPRMAVAVDVNALFLGGYDYIRAISQRFMSSLEFFLHNHNFTENLLPFPFRQALLNFIDSSESVGQPDFETDEEIEVDNGLEALKESAIKALEQYKLIVEEYSRIQQNSMQRNDIDAEAVGIFVDMINDFEEILVSLDSIFKEFSLYLHKSRYIAGWDLDHVNTSVDSQLGLNSNLHFGGKPEPFSKLRVNSQVVGILRAIREKLGAQIIFFSDADSRIDLEIFKRVPEIRSLIQADSTVNERSIGIGLESDSQSRIIANLYSTNLLSIAGETFPFADIADPLNTRTYKFRLIDGVWPVSMVFFTSYNDRNLATNVVRGGGYGVYVSEETVPEATTTFGFETSAHLTPLEAERFLLLKSG